MRQNIKWTVDNWSFSSVEMQDDNFNTTVWGNQRSEINTYNSLCTYMYAYIYKYICKIWEHIQAHVFVGMLKNCATLPGDKVR